MTSSDTTSRCWDHEDCPVTGCDGDLQQQDKYNVMCLSCEGVWSHVKTQTKHYLQTVDFETVAEKPVTMADGGTSRPRGRSTGGNKSRTPSRRGGERTRVVDS